MWPELELITHRCVSAIRRSSPTFLGDEVRCCLFYCIVLCVLENGCHLPSCGLGATVGWVGAPSFFFDQFFKEGFSLVLAVALKPLHRKLLVSGRTPAGLWRSFSTASGPGSRPSLSFLFCGGAACRCWLGTWPHDPLPWGSMPLLV